jgi:hypothetical protein
LEKKRWRGASSEALPSQLTAATDVTVEGFHLSPPTQKTIDRKVREREGEKE